MLLHGNKPVEIMYFPWMESLCARFEAEIGNPKWQSLWEFLTLLLTLMVWGHLSTTSIITIVGDNIAALSNSISMKGGGQLNAVARELSWRKVAYRWHFQVAHLPSELNVWADALSRLFADPPHVFPAVLTGCQKCTVPSVDVKW